MRMSVTVGVLVACGVALCLIQPCQPMPHVVQAGGGTLVVMREETQDVDVEVELDVKPGQNNYADRVPDDLPVADDDDGEEEEMTQCSEVPQIATWGRSDVYEVIPTTTTITPPPRKCSLRGCWKCCQRRGYNWGLCLWKKCHCYY